MNYPKNSAPAIRARIRLITAEKLGVPEKELTDETSFLIDLETDSLDKYELIMEVEKVFNIKISEEKAEKMTTIGHIISYVTNHLIIEQQNSH